MLAKHTDCVQAQSRHLFSTEPSPPGTYGPTTRCWHALTTPTRTGTTCANFPQLLVFCCRPIIQLGQMGLGLERIAGVFLYNIHLDNVHWTSPWCHVRVENVNDSDMSDLATSSLALFSCKHHLRCCTHVPTVLRTLLTRQG